MSDDVKILVEANSFETHVLWEKYHKSVDWKRGFGVLLNVGRLGPNMPVNIDIMYEILDGNKVGFWSACSRFVDYDMINNYLFKEFQGVRMVDANNFAIGLLR